MHEPTDSRGMQLHSSMACIAAYLLPVVPENTTTTLGDMINEGADGQLHPKVVPSSQLYISCREFGS